MKYLIRGLMAATALTVAMPVFAATVEETIVALPDAFRAQYEGAPQTITLGRFHP